MHGYLILTKVYQKALGKFTETDANKEGFNNLTKFKQYWQKNIGEWTSSAEVWIHEFEVVSQLPKTG